MKGIYLAISMTSSCNLKCFYCKPTGESISQETGTIPVEDFKRITAAAYRAGIRKFRLTGGECTLVSYFGEAIEHLMQLGPDSTINICSNGYRLSEYVDLISKYKDRIHVRISVDSLSEHLNGYHFPKHLSQQTRDLTRQLVESGIETRYNIVVTSYNVQEVPAMIEESLKLGVNLKLLDLYIQDIYLGGSGTSENFWSVTYQSLTQFRPLLDRLCDTYKTEYWDDSAYGIPMGAYFYGKQSIILKDSSRGAHFSRVCMEQCPLYKQCQEGIYVPFLSVGDVLHINGCHNKQLRWYLKDMDDSQMDGAFAELLGLFKELTVRQDASDKFRCHTSFRGVSNEI